MVFKKFFFKKETPFTEKRINIMSSSQNLPSINTFLSGGTNHFSTQEIPHLPHPWKIKKECNEDIYPDRLKTINLDRIKIKIEYPCESQIVNQKINTQGSCIAICITLIEEWHRIRGLEEEELDWQDSIIELGNHLYKAWNNRKKRTNNLNDFDIGDETRSCVEELFEVISKDERNGYLFSDVFSGTLTKSYNNNSDPRLGIYDIHDAMVINVKEAGDFFIIVIRDKSVLVWMEDEVEVEGLGLGLGLGSGLYTPNHGGVTDNNNGYKNTTTTTINNKENIYHIFDSHGHDMFGRKDKAFFLTLLCSLDDLVSVILKLYYLDEDQRRNLDPLFRNGFRGFKIRKEYQC